MTDLALSVLRFDVAERARRYLTNVGGVPGTVISGMPFALLVLATFNNTPDDALITARYAQHVLAGLGPVYNVGERVEGFSSPLHLLLTVGLLALPGGFVLLKMKLLSLL